MIEEAPREQPVGWFASPPRWLAARLPCFYGWVIVAVGALGLLCSGPGQSAVIAVFMDPMLAELGLSRSAIAAAFTVGNLVAALGMGPVGRLTDRLGGQGVLVAGVVVLGATCLLMGRVAELIGLTLGFSLLRMIVQGPLALTGTTVVAQWFVRRRGRAQSLMSLGMTASFAVFPPLTVLLIDWLGWRLAWVAIGLLVWLALLPPLVLLVRSRPEDLGLRPDGDPAAEPLGAARQPVDADERAWTVRQATRTTTFWLLAAAVAVTWLVGSGLNFHQVSILVSQGHSATFAAALFTVAAVLSVPATFLSGALLDRLPARPLLVGMLLIQAATAWCLLGAASPVMAVGYGALNGVMIGLSSVVNAVIFALYYGRRHLGSIRGITMIVNVAASALGALPLGLARDLLGSYDAALVGLGLLPVLVALTMVWVRPPARR
jgi:sugar phosphate permease